MGIESDSHDDRKQIVLDSSIDVDETQRQKPLRVPEIQFSTIRERNLTQPPIKVFIPDDMQTVIAVDKDGRFVGKFTGVELPPNTFPVTVDTDSAFRIWNFDTQIWGDIQVPVPTFVLKKPLVMMLRDLGFLSQIETLSFLARGDFPSAFMKAFEFMSQRVRDDAEIDLVIESTVLRDSPFIGCFIKAHKLSSSAMDQIFIDCSSNQ